jgi:hypothetical protein
MLPAARTCDVVIRRLATRLHGPLRAHSSRADDAESDVLCGCRLRFLHPAGELSRT